MERLADDTIESFLNAIEERLAEGQKNKIPFSRFLEEKMDAFDYSNTVVSCHYLTTSISLLITCCFDSIPVTRILIL